MTEVNLVPVEVRRRREAGRWRARWAWCVALVGSAAGVVVGVGRLGSGEQLTQLERDGARLEQERAELSVRIPQLRAEVERAERLAGAATLLAERADWGRLLALAERSRGEGVVLGLVEMEGLAADGKAAGPGEAARVRVTISGLAERQGAVQAFVLALEESGVFDAVQPRGTAPATLNGVELIGFEVQGTIGSAMAGAGGS